MLKKIVSFLLHTSTSLHIPSIFLIILSGYQGGNCQIRPMGNPNIHSYSKSTYGGGTQNWAIAQDERGVLYFGNNKGLLEFDGHKWNLLPLPNLTIVRSLFYQKEDKMYIGGQDELGFLDQKPNGEPFYQSLTSHIPDSCKSFADVWKIFSIKGAIFFCTSHYIFKWQSESMEIIKSAIPMDRFFAINEDLIIQDQNLNLKKLEEGNLIDFLSDNSLVRFALTAVLPMEKGELLIVSAEKGLFKLTSKTISPFNCPANSFLSKNRTYTGIKLNNNRFAIGSPQNGFVIIDKNGQIVLHLNRGNGLQNNTILSIFQDNHENLWLALDNGIDYVGISSPHYLLHRDVGLKGTCYTSTVFEDKLYVGTNQGLFVKTLLKTNSLENASSFNQIENTAGQVWSLNRLNKYLLLGHHEGLFWIRDDQSIPIPSPNGVWKILQLRETENHFLVGTYEGLYLYKFEKTSRSPFQLIKKLKGFEESARVIEQDSEGNIWISHAYKGLYRIRLSRNFQEIESIHFYANSNGLPTQLSINVAKLRGEVVFTAPEGVFEYLTQTDSFQLHPEFSKVFSPSDPIRRLLQDENDDIWFATDQSFGLIRIIENGLLNDLEKKYFNFFQPQLVDGFEHVFAFDPSNIFISTTKGLVHLNPLQKEKKLSLFKPFIRSFSVSTSSKQLMGRGSAGLSLSKKLRLRNNENHLRIYFAAPYYRQLEHIKYRHRLIGFNTEWSEWNQQQTKEYTNLEPGDYLFEVEAQNGYGEKSQKTTLSFSILPPWYATSIAKLSFSALGGFLLFGAIWLNRRKNKKEKLALISQKEEEIRQKEEVFKTEAKKSSEMISRLNEEKLEAAIQHKNSELASATMHLVQKGEILIKLKNELNKLLPSLEGQHQSKVKSLIKTIDQDVRLDDDWDKFKIYFDQVYENFFKRLQESYPSLTPKDQKLCAYLRMNLSTKEIAPLLNISVRGVEISRYRLRKKLDIDSNTNLVDFILKI